MYASIRYTRKTHTQILNVIGHTEVNKADSNWYILDLANR